MTKSFKPTLLKNNPLFRRLGQMYQNGRRLSKNAKSNLKLGLKGRLMWLPVEIITNEFGFSYGPDGWNYFRALVAEYDQNPEIRLEDSTFYRFFQTDDIKAARYFNDVLFLHDQRKWSSKDGFNFYFDINPWGGWYKRDSAIGGKPWGYQYDLVEGQKTRDIWGGYNRNIWYRPGDTHPLKLEWQKTIDLFDSIKQGYQILQNRAPPEIALLVRNNGERRAVIVDGQHRTSILSYLGQKKILVTMGAYFDSIGVIREDEVKQWYYVKNGYCTEKQALEIFQAFFVFDGRERVRHLGLHPVY